MGTHHPPVSIGVALWIAAFDINYARMDVESDQEQGIHSFPSKFGETATTHDGPTVTRWFACFAISDPMDGIWFLAAAAVMALANIFVVLRMERLLISKRCSSGCRCSRGGCCWLRW